jgi:hypothetical protein
MSTPNTPPGFRREQCGNDLTAILPTPWEFHGSEGAGYYRLIEPEHLAEPRSELTFSILGSTAFDEIGMCLYTLRNVQKYHQMSPSQMAERHLTKDRQDWQPLDGGVASLLKPDISLFSANYLRPAGPGQGRLSEPTIKSLLAIGINSTDTVHLATFQAPERRWEEVYPHVDWDSAQPAENRTLSALAETMLGCLGSVKR